MDPLSIVAGMASVVQIASVARRTLDEITRSTKSIPHDVRMVANELSSVIEIQHSFVRLLQNQNRMPTSSILDQLTAILEVEREIILDISKLGQKLQREGARSRILWSFERDRWKEVYERLALQKSTMVLFLSNASFQYHENLLGVLRDGDRLVIHPSGSAPASLPEGAGNNLEDDVQASPKERAHSKKILQALASSYGQCLVARWKRYYDKIMFIAAEDSGVNIPRQSDGNKSYYLKVGYYEDTSDKPRLEELNDDLLISVLSDVVSVTASTSERPKHHEHKLLLIISELDSNASIILPYTSTVCLSIAQRVKLPPVFFRALYIGTPQSIPCRGEHDEEGFVFRTPKSIKENWTLGLSWNSTFDDLRGFLCGLHTSEREALARHLDDSREELHHPMNLPVILCEMLTESDSHGIKAHAAMLYDVEFKTRTALTTKDLDAEGPDFGEMTRSLNTIISRLAFHDMRIQASRVFVEQIQEHVARIRLRLSNAAEEAMQGPRASLKAADRSLQERLVHLKIEHEALGLEIALNQRIAQSQLEIVYNLVAQRDNHDNRTLAEISTEIAITTKDDSFAMRTLAIMSIAFLPGTFVASFFSMTMFNWQAPEGTSVLSSHFWVYWAVTGPLTLVVFLTWFYWYRAHQNHSTFEQKLRSRIHPQGVQRPDASGKFWEDKRWYPRHWIRSKAKDEEKQVIEELRVPNGSTTSVTPEAVLRQRVPTAQVHRADTIPQGPLR